MVEVAQKLHLTQCPQTEHAVIEGRDLLDRDLLAGGFVNGRARGLATTIVQLHPSEDCFGSELGYPYSPHNSIGTLTYDILYIVLFRDIE